MSHTSGYDEGEVELLPRVRGCEVAGLDPHRLEDITGITGDIYVDHITRALGKII